jgi:hypothetical protein
VTEKRGTDEYVDRGQGRAEALRDDVVAVLDREGSIEAVKL